MTKNTIIINIKRIRKALNITQQQAADALGISRISYIQRENEKIDFKVGELSKLAQFFCADIEDILDINLPQSRIISIGEAFNTTHQLAEPHNHTVRELSHLFEGMRVRSIWQEDEEKWYFSIIDIVAILTDQPDTRGATLYWSKLKSRLRNEGASQLLTSCQQLKLRSSDGKHYLTDVADTEQVLRIVQSIPSKKAEPFKQWLARVGAERIDEDIDPELAMQRAVETYQRKGYDEEWIRQRLLAIKIRHELTDEWHARGITRGTSFAILTDEISKAWSGMTTREYKNFKNLKQENLRDNMTDTELVLSMLAEASTRDISKSKNPETFAESQLIAREGGTVAGAARRALEKQLDHPVITSRNAKQLQSEQSSRPHLPSAK